jgi:hypothetical protein
MLNFFIQFLMYQFAEIAILHFLMRKSKFLLLMFSIYQKIITLLAQALVLVLILVLVLNLNHYTRTTPIASGVGLGTDASSFYAIPAQCASASTACLATWVAERPRRCARSRCGSATGASPFRPSLISKSPLAGGSMRCLPT